jgi:uncharacterized protein involved in response to NO
MAPPVRLDPYRPLFLVGIAHAVAGTLLWPLATVQAIGYPGLLHRTLMIEGFEQSFIAGFLLTALGGLTHGGRSTTVEVALATAAQVGVGVAALAGHAALAHMCFLGSVLVLLTAAVIRSRRGRSQGHPPRELIFIVTALLLGLCGGAVLVSGALRASGALVAFGLRLVSLGGVLTLVVGVGSILVPTFLGHRTPNVVATISKPGWRGQAEFYAVVVLLLAGSFVLETAGLGRLAATARALGVSAVLLGVWKIHRPSATNLALSLRTAGFAILVGLWTAVWMPERPLLGEHAVFIGGYGFLTMGIATRVIVLHGGWPQHDETRLLHPFVLLALALALVFRLAAEFVPPHASDLWAASGSVWTLAWLWWARGAVPRILVLSPARKPPL